MKFKNTQKWIKASLVAGLIITTSIFTGCKNDDDVEPLKSIVQIVVDDPNFSFLEAAVVKANLVTPLSGAGPFTVFAPTNQAFINAGFANEAAVTAAPASVLANILGYHVLPNRTDASAIPTAANTAVVTLNSSTAFVTKTAAGNVTVNGVQVVQADINASNGVIHVINAVLTPPAGNIVETASATPSLSYLVAAVVRANEGTTKVVQILSGSGPFTVFAPTNAAFIAAGFPTIASIQAASPNTLASILTYHVIAGRILSTDLTEGANPATLNGGRVTVTLSGGAKVKGNTNTSASNIIQVNIITTNGVVHVIDRVLLQ